MALPSIFFLDDITTPFNFDKLPNELEEYEQKNGKGKLRTIMECVRWAPSARNWQEWRIMYDSKEKSFVFFTQKASHYYKYIDIGIAMCHFELIALECNLQGKWNIEDRKFEFVLPKPLEYHFEWKLN